MTFARKFPEDLESQPNKLKAAVLDEMTPLQYCKLMPYWSRNGCGVKVLQEDETTWADVHSFSFNSSSAPRRYKLAVAVRCDELTVARLNETLFSFFFWPIYIYISKFPRPSAPLPAQVGDLINIVLSMCPSSVGYELLDPRKNVQELFQGS